MKHRGLRRIVTIGSLALAGASSCLLGCQEERGRSTQSGDPIRGRRLASQYGCGNCHVIPDLPGARSTVGPPLTELGKRTYAGGRLNTPAQLSAFLQNPQAINPQSPMPRLGITPRDAQDLVAYLHRLR